MNSEIRNLILLIHGIREEAEWHERVSPALSAPGTEVQSCRYEYLDLFRFWFPFFTRRQAIRRIHWRIRESLRLYPNADVSIVAHSFGTYAIVEILTEFPDIEVSRLILCGSIVDRDYRWDRLSNIPSAIINECGSRDIWPILAQATTWGFGASGAFGFGTPRVKDRFHPTKHSEYLTREFAEKYWRPWLHDNEYVPSMIENDRPNVPPWKSLLANLPLRWMIVVVMFLGMVVAGALVNRTIATRSKVMVIKASVTLPDLSTADVAVLDGSALVVTRENGPTFVFVPALEGTEVAWMSLETSGGLVDGLEKERPKGRRLGSPQRLPTPAGVFEFTSLRVSPANGIAIPDAVRDSEEINPGQLSQHGLCSVDCGDWTVKATGVECFRSRSRCGAGL